MFLSRLVLFLSGAAICIAQNSTKSADFTFSIEEVAVLSRQFLDFLLNYDETQVAQSSDQRCVSSLKQLSVAYVNRERHGFEWFDSWGKLPSGLYYGNGYAIGNYEQCRRFSWKDVRGQHCTFMAAFPNEFPIFYSGLCVPQFCSQQAVQELYTDYMSGKGVRVLPSGDRIMCYKDQELEFSGAVVTAIVMFSSFAVIVVISTSYELVQLMRNQKIQVQYAAFSLHRNLRSILHIVHQPSDSVKKAEMIECAHGIRSLSMLWIISHHVHTAVYLLFYNNPSSRNEYKKGFTATILYDVGFFAVDTFFALSGMLASLSLLKELDQNGQINPLKLYLRRYIRLTAPLAPLVLFVVSFSEYTGEGPIWILFVEKYVDSCKEHWWSALLHIQNYVNPSRICLPWSWYVSVEMQLYILAPALIYPVWRWGKRALFGVGGLALVGIIYVLVTFLVNDLRIADEGLRKEMTYYPTHCRMAVWLLGTIFGCILHKTKHTRVNLPKQFYALGWSTCFVFLSLIVYATYKIVHSDPREFSGLADAVYESLSRPVFGICVMWIIFACVNGQGGVINDFLSSELWQPLARLSYSMYLLHSVPLVTATAAGSKTDSYFNVMDMWNRLFGIIGLTACLSLIWSSVFEVPFGTLEKIVFGR